MMRSSQRCAVALMLATVHIVLSCGESRKPADDSALPPQLEADVGDRGATASEGSELSPPLPSAPRGPEVVDAGVLSAERPDAGAVDSGVAEVRVGPSYEDFFDNTKLARINITIDPKDLEPGDAADRWLDRLWDRWYHCGPYDNYTRATMEYISPDGKGDAVLEDVGIRLRGSKGREANELQGFKLHFDKLLPNRATEKKRRFAGVNRLNALSIEADSSLLLQCLAYKIFSEAGLPAPRCNHLVVYVNGDYYGIMQNVEEVDDGRFLRHHFETNEGSLYEASSGCGFPDSKANLRFKGAVYSPESEYATEYNIVRGSPEQAGQDLIPMLKCGDRTQTPDDEEFKQCVQEWIDVDEWLLLVAGESVAPSLESLVGAKRNYYLYFHPDVTAPHGGRFMAYSWDYDAALSNASCFPGNCDPLTSVAGWYGPRGKRADLILRLTEVFRTEYCAKVEEFFDLAMRPEIVDEMARVLEAEIATGAAVYDYDKGTKVEPTKWQAKIGRLHRFIQDRRAGKSEVVRGCLNSPVRATARSSGTGF